METPIPCTANPEQLEFLAWFGQHMAQYRISVSKTRMAMGAMNMDFVDPDGRSPIGLLCQRQARLFNDKEADILSLLLERGANPLGPGHPLAETLGHATRSLRFASRMLAFEVQHPGLLRAHDGGNIFHAMGLRRPRDLERLLQPDEHRTPIFALASEARHTDGATVGHMIWRGVQFDGPNLDRRKKTPDPYSNPVIAALVGTTALIEAGVDLTVADAMGQSASQLAIECFETKLARVPMGWANAIKRLRKLAEATPAMKPDAFSGRGRGPRL